jgi:hypothetical protein
MQLQIVDSEVNRLEEEKEKAKRDLLSAQEALVKAQQGVEMAKKEAESFMKTRVSMELDSKSKLAAISKHKEEIYQVKSNEAYAALQSEIAKLAIENASLEEQTLVKMEEEEAARKRIVLGQSQIKAAEQKVKETESSYQEQVVRIDALIQAKTAEGKVISDQIDKGSIDHYRRIRDNREGVAIAEVRDGICGECRMTVRPQMLIEVQRSPKLVLCESCSRILYME